MVKVDDIEFVEVETDAVEAVAEVVVEPSPTLMVTHDAVPEIVGNFEQLEAYVAKLTDEYGAFEAVDEETFKALKSDRADVNKAINGIDAARRSAKAEFERPVKEFEQRIKAIVEPAKAVESAMGDEVKAYEARWKERRRDYVRAAYEEAAPFIALTLEGQTAPLVPFERIERKEWMLRGTNEVAACDDMRKVVAAIASGEADVRAMHLAHEEEAIAAYFSTLSVTSARERDRDLCDAESRARAMEAERARLVDEEPEPVPMPEEPVEAPETVSPQAVATPAERVYARKFVELHDVTTAQLVVLLAFLKANGIHGMLLNGLEVNA